MATTLQKLYEKANYLYSMNLIAGDSGMNNIVQWVHIIEDAEVSGFISGGELIFTTGIAQSGTQWLIPFVKNLMKNGASGIVVNIGPYIKTLPKDFIDFCNDSKFPLLVVPWKTKLVDISRDFCNQIIRGEKETEDIATTFQNITTYPNQWQQYSTILERYGFNINGKYCIMGIRVEMTEKYENITSTIRYEVERRVSSFKKNMGCFNNGEDLFVVFCDYENSEIENIANSIAEKYKKDKRFENIYVSVGSQNSILKKLSKSYHIVLSMLNLSQKNGMNVSYYDKFNVKKLLLAVDEQSLLESYVKNTLGKLQSYDKGNGTNYVNDLRVYLECDCSVQLVAQKMYTHRNTVNYKLTKIKSILDIDLSTLEERFKLMLAYHILDIL